MSCTASNIMGMIRYKPIAEAFSSELPSSASDALGKFCHIEVQILGNATATRLP